LRRLKKLRRLRRLVRDRERTEVEPILEKLNHYYPYWRAWTPIVSGFFCFMWLGISSCTMVVHQGPRGNLEPSDISVQTKEKADVDSIEIGSQNVDTSGRAEGLIPVLDSQFVPSIGVIVPEFASPRVIEATNEILEGIRVALDIFEKANEGFRKPELVVFPAGDDIDQVVTRLKELPERQVLGFLTALQENLVRRISEQAALTIPIISLAPASVQHNSEDFISIVDVADPSASRALAQQAISSGLSTAAIVHSRELGSTFEAEVFAEVFEDIGGSILGVFDYPAGATFFEDELRSAEALLPDVLFLPVPRQDVELVAPQVTFFGLDSLGIRIFGTSAWSQDEVLEVVDTRHTDGVVTASPYPVDEVFPAYVKFIEVYENLHQRTLPSLSPSFGFDAASLIFKGIEMGARTKEELLGALNRITDFPGATGILSVEGGKVLRKHFVACLQDRRRTRISPFEQAQPILMPPLPDPETDSIPEDAPDRIMGFRCTQSIQ